MEYTGDLKSSAERHAGSSPVRGTKFNLRVWGNWSDPEDLKSSALCMSVRI